MSNVFKRFTEVVNKPNRAPYDLSFQNNLTMKFGKLYPVFCKEVLPGDSFKIQPTFNFNFMPLVSPVQTRMKATLHFFYVRNRPQWKDFMDWDGMTKEGLTPPYIKLTEQNRDMVTTGEIGDFLGIPTEVYGDTYDYLFDESPKRGNNGLTFSGAGYAFNGTTLTTNNTSMFEAFSYASIGDSFTYASGQSPFYTTQYDSSNDTDKFVVQTAIVETAALLQAKKVRITLKSYDYAQNGYFALIDTNGIIRFKSELIEIPVESSEKDYPFEFDIKPTLDWFSPSTLNSRAGTSLFVFIASENNVRTSSTNIAAYRVIPQKLSVSDLSLRELPWASDENPDGLRLNAFPFRAYEAIYNSFYRDERNNPRMVNGQPEYNKYITTDEGGADTTHYKLFQRNWEPDYLTTAVQSPQQGVAPLVGITSVSAAGTIEITDGNGVTYTAQTKLAEDGDTIQGIRVLSENSPTAVNRALVDLASTGISISDLRNVNALQRWLEINMRRGLRYRDQVKSHYGVDIEFKELQMPEFIGGVNEDVIVNRISQTVETEENPLGSLAGQAGVLGTSKHQISHYCDEKGFIIGIFSIAPVPNYSQNLPKHMIKTSQLDYFTPEFAHIGMQPILNSEVTPLQANLEGKLNDVFGYQRPWYEYLASTDEVHGQFRDTMRRYLINRVYDGTPQLGSEFLTIDPDQINDVFAVTEDTDKIYGQIWFDVTAKRPIASNVTPRIEP